MPPVWLGLLLLAALCGIGKGELVAGQSATYHYQSRQTSTSEAEASKVVHSVEFEVEAVGQTEQETFLDLRVTKAELEHDGESFNEHFNHAMKEYPLSFTILRNGRIGDILTDPREDYEILNLKRGMLSALQTHGINEEEFNRRRSAGERSVSFSDHVADTTGRCMTDFTMTMEGDEMHVVSKRDYKECSYRPLQRKQAKKDKSRLTSSFKQEQKIDRMNSLLSHSSFQEVHEFIPHNGREHLAPITNTFTGQLNLVQAGKPVRKRQYFNDVQALGKRMAGGFRLTNLYMEDAAVQRFERRKRGDLTAEEEAIQQPILNRVFDFADRIAEKYLRHDQWLHNGDPVEVPDIAEEFVANPFVMQSVLRLCLAGRPSNKCDFAAFTVLLDALGVVGRHDGSDALISWYLNPAATVEEKDAVLDTLALMMHPSIEAVREVFSWLPEPGQYQDHARLYLTLGAMTGRYQAEYCDQNAEEEDCQFINHILSELMARLDNTENLSEQEFIVRALGNSKTNLHVVADYLNHPSEHMQTAAVSATRKFVTEDAPVHTRRPAQAYLLDVLGDRSVSFTVRKDAGHGLLRQPKLLTAPAVDSVLDIMETEQDVALNQLLFSGLRHAAEESSNVRSHLHLVRDRLYNTSAGQPLNLDSNKNQRRNIVQVLLGDVLGIDRFEVNLGECNVNKEQWGHDEFGIRFKSTFCNTAAAKWPFFGFPTINLGANDGVFLGADVLFWHPVMLDVGVDLGLRTGTWASSQNRKRYVAAAEEALLANQLQRRGGGGFAGPDITCPPGLDFSCGLGKCVAHLEECLFVKYVELNPAYQTWNFIELGGITDLDSAQQCNEGPLGGSGPSSCSYYDDNNIDLGLPDSFRLNNKLACQAIFDDADTVDPPFPPQTSYLGPNNCVRKYLQDKLTTLRGSATWNTLKTWKSDWKSRRDDINDAYDLLPAALQDPAIRDFALRANDIVYFGQLGLPGGVFDELAENWINAYDECCCDVKPTWFAGWITALQVNLTNLLGTNAAPFVQKNYGTFGWCNDKRTLFDFDRAFKDHYWLEVIETDMIAEIGVDPSCKVPDTDYKYSLRCADNTNSGGVRKRGSDAVTQVDPAQLGGPGLCFNIPDTTLWERYTQILDVSYSIPVYAGITLDVGVSAGFQMAIKAQVKLCPFSLGADAGVGPNANFQVKAYAAVSIFLIRAGITITVTIMDTTLLAHGNVTFTKWPLDVCFGIQLTMQPIKIRVAVFVQIRWVIVWCFIIPCGLDWGDPWEYPIVEWGSEIIGPFELWGWCSARPRGTPIANDVWIDVDEDTPVQNQLFNYSGIEHALSLLEAQGEGAVKVTDKSGGKFSYGPLLHSDRDDTFTYVVSDGDVESPIATAHVVVWPVADTPQLFVGRAVSWEDPPQPIALNITARLVDQDDSETLNITICNCFENDYDGDEVGDRCDVCPFVSNPGLDDGVNIIAWRYDQQDTDEDGIGDVCCQDHLRAFWQFEEGEGVFAYDSLLFNNDLKIKGAHWVPSYVPSMGTALKFLNTKVNLIAPNDFDALGFSGSHTIVLWINIDWTHSNFVAECPPGSHPICALIGTAYAPVVSKTDSTQTYNRWSLMLHKNNLPVFRFRYHVNGFASNFSGGTSFWSRNLTDAERAPGWHQLAIVYDTLSVPPFKNSSVSFFFDGFDISSTAAFTVPITGVERTDVVSLGHRKYFRGMMDEVQIYEEALDFYAMFWMFLTKKPVPYGSDLDGDKIDDWCDNCPAISNPDQSNQACCLMGLWRMQTTNPALDSSGRFNALDIDPANLRPGLGLTNNQIAITDIGATFRAYRGPKFSFFNLNTYLNLFPMSGSFGGKFRIGGTFPISTAAEYMLVSAGYWNFDQPRACNYAIYATGSTWLSQVECHNWNMRLVAPRAGRWTKLIVGVHHGGQHSGFNQAGWEVVFDLNDQLGVGDQTQLLLEMPAQIRYPLDVNYFTLPRVYQAGVALAPSLNAEPGPFFMPGTWDWGYGGGLHSLNPQIIFGDPCQSNPNQQSCNATFNAGNIRGGYADPVLQNGRTSTGMTLTWEYAGIWSRVFTPTERADFFSLQKLPCTTYVAPTQKREPPSGPMTTKDLDYLCGCGLAMPKGSAFTLGNTDLPLPIKVKEEDISSLGLRPAPDQAGSFCFEVFAIATEKEPARISSNQNAVTSRPMPVLIYPLNDAPQVAGKQLPAATNGETPTAFWTELWDIDISDVDAFGGACSVIISWTRAATFVWTPNGAVWYNTQPQSLELVGSLDAINTGLYGASFVLSPTAVPFQTADTLSIVVDDFGNSGYATAFPLSKRLSTAFIQPVNLTSGPINLLQPGPIFVDPYPAIPLLASVAYLNGTDFQYVPLQLRVLTTKGGGMAISVSVLVSADYGNITFPVVGMLPVGSATVTPVPKNGPAGPVVGMRVQGPADDVSATLQLLTYYSGIRCGEDSMDVRMNYNCPVNRTTVQINIVCVASAPNLTVAYTSEEEDKTLRLSAITLEATQPREALALELCNVPKGFDVEKAFYQASNGCWMAQVKFKNLLGTRRRAPIQPSVQDSVQEAVAWPWYIGLTVIPGLAIRPPFNFNGVVNITVIGYSTDPSSPFPANTTKNMTLEWLPRNDPPVITSPMQVTCYEDTPCNISLPVPISFSDLDLEPAEYGTLEYIVSIAPAPSVIYLPGQFWFPFYNFFTARGALSVRTAPVVGVDITAFELVGRGLSMIGTLNQMNAILPGLVFTPDAHDFGTVGYNIVITDPYHKTAFPSDPTEQLTVIQYLKIVVNNVNDPPVIQRGPAALASDPIPHECEAEPVNGCPVVLRLKEDDSDVIVNSFSFFDLDWNDYMQATFQATGNLLFQPTPETIVSQPKNVTFIDPNGPPSNFWKFHTPIGDSTISWMNNPKGVNLTAQWMMYSGKRDQNGWDTLKLTLTDYRDLDFRAYAIWLEPVNDYPLIAGANVPHNPMLYEDPNLFTTLAQEAQQNNKSLFEPGGGFSTLPSVAPAYNLTSVYPSGVKIRFQATIYDDADELPFPTFEVEVSIPTGKATIEWLITPVAPLVILNSVADPFLLRFAGPLYNIRQVLKEFDIVPAPGYTGPFNISMTVNDVAQTGLGPAEGLNGSFLMTLTVDDSKVDCATGTDCLRNVTRTACQRLGTFLAPSGAPIDCDRYTPTSLPCCKGPQCFMTDPVSCRDAGGIGITFGTCLTASCPVTNACCVPRSPTQPAGGSCSAGPNTNADTCKRSHPLSIYYPNMDCSMAPCDDLDYNATDFPRDVYNYGACCLRGECYARMPPESCRRIGGSYMGTTMCGTAGVCAATSPYGRCCYYQGSQLSCLPDSLKLDCVLRNGAWTPGQNCSSTCKAPRLPDPLPVDDPPTPGIGGSLPPLGFCVRNPPRPETACPVVDWSIWSEVTGTELNLVFANGRKVGRNISHAILRAKDCELNLTLTQPFTEPSCSVFYQTATLLLADLASCNPITKPVGQVNAELFEVVAWQNYLPPGSSQLSSNTLVYQFWLVPGSGVPTVSVTGQATQPTAEYDAQRHIVRFTLNYGRLPVFTDAPPELSVSGAGPYTVELALAQSSCGQSFVFYDQQAGYVETRVSLVVPDSVCWTAGTISSLAYSISTCNASSVVVFQSNKNIGWLLLETPTCAGSVWFTRVPIAWNDGLADRLIYTVYPRTPAWSLYLDLNPFFAAHSALRLDHIVGPSGPTQPCETTPPTGTQTNSVGLPGTQNTNTAGTNGGSNGGTGSSNGGSNPGTGTGTDTNGNGQSGTASGSPGTGNTDINSNGGGSGTNPTQGQTGPNPTGTESTPSPTNNDAALPVLARLLFAALLL